MAGPRGVVATIGLMDAHIGAIDGTPVTTVSPLVGVFAARPRTDGSPKDVRGVCRGSSIQRPCPAMLSRPEEAAAQTRHVSWMP